MSAADGRTPWPGAAGRLAAPEAVGAPTESPTERARRRALDIRRQFVKGGQPRRDALHRANYTDAAPGSTISTASRTSPGVSGG